MCSHPSRLGRTSPVRLVPLVRLVRRISRKPKAHERVEPTAPTRERESHDDSADTAASIKRTVEPDPARYPTGDRVAENRDASKRDDNSLTGLPTEQIPATSSKGSELDDLEVPDEEFAARPNDLGGISRRNVARIAQPLRTSDRCSVQEGSLARPGAGSSASSPFGSVPSARCASGAAVTVRQGRLADRLAGRPQDRG